MIKFCCIHANICCELYSHFRNILALGSSSPLCSLASCQGISPSFSFLLSLTTCGAERGTTFYKLVLGVIVTVVDFAASMVEQPVRGGAAVTWYPRATERGRGTRDRLPRMKGEEDNSWYLTANGKQWRRHVISSPVMAARAAPLTSVIALWTADLV